MRKSADAQRLYDDFYRRITRQQLQPGEMIPSENELAERYGISRPTVRKMLKRLNDGGFLETRTGIGSFVSAVRNGRSAAPDRPFKIGLDACGDSRFYYPDILQCIRKLPYREQIFLNFLDPEMVARGEIHRQLDALLLVRNRFQDKVYQTFAARGLPMVHFNRQYPIPGAGFVSVDHTQEAERAVNFLFSAGCRRIALIGEHDTPDRCTPYLRSLGFKNACRNFSGTIPEELMVSLAENRRGGYMKRLLEASPDGFFFVNMAQYNSFKLEYGKYTGRSSDELYCIVFDDVDREFPGEYPRVNFVRMPMEQMIKACIEYLWQKSNDLCTADLRLTLPCDLIIRLDKTL